jgi:GR25 family glycosyltransferase involved in LPS biosynthesis
MNIKLIAILIFCIVIFAIYFNNYNETNEINEINETNEINEIYVINLKKRPERLKQFQNNYKLNKDFKLIEAIDGNNINNIHNIIGDEGKRSLDNYYIYNIKRKYHYELSSYGAIGCYLSHIYIWNDIIKNNNKNALIFEDDTNVYSNIKYNDIIKRLNSLPKDWDIYLLINPDFCYDKIKINKHLYKVKRFFLLHSYIININACKKIIENGKLFPINQQIDHHLSELALLGKINIYINNNLPYYNTIEQKSDIQLNTSSNLSYERFAIT